MTPCRKCWNRGRALEQGCCICTGDVLLPTAFHEWNATRRHDYKLPQEVVVEKPAPEFKIKLEFGKRPDTGRKKTSRKGR